MEKAAIFAVLSLSLAATLLLSGSVDACEDAPSMSAASACQRASHVPAVRQHAGRHDGPA
ncbi:hypothetical protein E2562_038313 [Oryza meyeriana var. granulata]|uniref:Uncharacterized protein n=1 Tax=Oryza meyeriana var. granulata TaxID=110450 RepID=A0A6G1CM44_9ORYZ|nr:hypothetical protein E2562_038313 [Oryza meyeriana var. granulata]